MRSRKEILFRLRQELGNLGMLIAPPAPGCEAKPPKAQPVPGSAAGEPAEIVAIADSILAHHFPLLGLTIETGGTIDWRRDYLHGISTGTDYFRRIPYLDFQRAGDHKIVWELNRHQHLPLLAQAFLITGKREYLDEAFRQLDSWMDANPFLRGINWASALEVAFRALSWGWLWRFAGDEMPEAVRRRFLTELYRHGRFLELNLSVYFSPNTHLLGEAVALHALGAWFPEWPQAARWCDIGGRIVADEIRRQVREDGCHFEQSIYYHVYALDFFLLHRELASGTPEYDERLRRMAEFLHAVMGPSGTLPLIGDDDGGRLFHPYGERMEFGRATMAQCAASGVGLQVGLQARLPWTSRYFADSGFAVMVSGDVHVVVKAGGFGEGSGGHSHSDVLSLVARLGDREILIDPGTFTYVADPAGRDQFRGAAAHNTVRIDGRDQAVRAGPFRWRNKPAVKVREWFTSTERDFLDATCAYAGFVHRRRILLIKPKLLVILDTIEGPAGEHCAEQFWHFGSPDEERRFSFSAPAERMEGWRSRAFASREPAPLLRVAATGPLPIYLAAVVDLSEAPEVRPVTVDGTVVRWGDYAAKLETGA